MADEEAARFGVQAPLECCTVGNNLRRCKVSLRLKRLSAIHILLISKMSRLSCGTARTSALGGAASQMGALVHPGHRLAVAIGPSVSHQR